MGRANAPERSIFPRVYKVLLCVEGATLTDFLTPGSSRSRIARFIYFSCFFGAPVDGCLHNALPTDSGHKTDSCIVCSGCDVMMASVFIVLFRRIYLFTSASCLVGWFYPRWLLRRWSRSDGVKVIMSTSLFG